MEHTIFLFIKTRILLLFLRIAIMHVPIHSLIPKYVGNNCYTIKKANEDKYLKSDTLQESNPYINELWGTEKEAGTFRITRKGNYYIICDVNTKRILSENDSNLFRIYQ